MKKFLAGVVVTITIICIVLVITNTKTTEPQNQPANQDSQQIEISPTETLVEEFHKLAHLETASIKITQSFNATKDNKRLWGILGEELTFIAKGEVIAGIDLSAITDNDFEFLNNQIVKVKLPRPQIFNVIIDNKTSYISSRTKGILATVDKNMETDIRIYAQEYFEKTALDSGILFQATMNATDPIQKLIQKFGYTTVIFSVDN